MSNGQQGVQTNTSTLYAFLKNIHIHFHNMLNLLFNWYFSQFDITMTITITIDRQEQSSTAMENQATKPPTNDHKTFKETNTHTKASNTLSHTQRQRKIRCQERIMKIYFCPFSCAGNKNQKQKKTKQKITEVNLLWKKQQI